MTISWPATAFHDTGGTDSGGITAAEYRCMHHSTHDSDEHAESLYEWDQTYSQLTPGAFEGEVLDMGFLGLQVFRETTNRTVCQQGSPMAECFVIGVPLAMSGPGLFSRQQFGMQHVVTCVGQQGFTLMSPQQFDVVAVTVPKTEMLRLLELERGNASVMARPMVLKPGAEQMQALRNCLLSMVTPGEFDAALLRNLQVQRILKSAVMTTALSAIESARPAEEPNRSFRARSYMVKEIIDWAMSRPDDPPSIADICLHFNVGRRLLNYTFLEVLGTNPLNYLRSMRLNGVRRDLRKAGSSTSIKEVAGRWGFWHLPRFSEEYRKLFGELPSETLRHASRLVA